MPTIFRGKKAVRSLGGAAGCTPAAVFMWSHPYGYWSEKRKGFEGSHCLASASANTLSIKGSATEEAIRAAVEGIGYTFKGKA